MISNFHLKSLNFCLIKIKKLLLRYLLYLVSSSDPKFIEPKMSLDHEQVSNLILDWPLTMIISKQNCQEPN